MILISESQGKDVLEDQVENNLEDQVKNDSEEGENNYDWYSALEEWDREIPEDSIFNFMTSDEFLELFDDDGNMFEDIDICDDSEILLFVLEKRYGYSEPENLIPVEELLEMFDDNGDKIKVEISVEDKSESAKRFEEEYDGEASKNLQTTVLRNELVIDKNKESISEPNVWLKDETLPKGRSRKNRKGKRGGKKTSENDSLKILQSNCDGYTSKKESINEIFEQKNPDVLLLNDTALNGKSKVRMKDCFSFCKNRKKAKGGVATVVSNKLRDSTVKVAEGKDEDEYVITRFDHVIPPVNVVNIYGQQESRTANDEIRDSWIRLRKDLQEIERRNEGVLILGDMNRAIGNDEWGVKDNHSRVSFGGQLIRDMLKDNDYKLLNNLDLAEGGPWTWVDRSDPSRKSCLDLGIASANLVPFVTKFKIDNKRLFTPRRVITKKGEAVSVYTDHYSVEIILEGMPTKRRKVEKVPKWNLNKPDGWKKYEELTNKSADKVDKIVEDEGMSTNERMKKIKALEVKIKFEAFGKTREKSYNAKNKNETEDKPEIEVDEETRNKELLKKQAEKIEAQVIEIKSKKMGRVGNVFKIKEAINGPKKGVQEPNAIRDPNTNELIVAGDKIKSVTLQHCVDTLKNNKPDEEVKESIELKKKLHDLRMNVKDGDLNIVKDDFKGILNKFKTKNTKSYDFLLKAGCKFQDSIFRFCKKMIEEEEFPDEFVLTLLHMIWKGKGPREMLGNNRFIHTKDYLPRTCEALVVSKMKEDILKASSIYQIGGQPGHSPEELIVCLKSVIARQESLNEGIIFFLVDIIKFFDKEDIYDVMQTLHEIQVNQKAARVWFKLNAGTRVKVKTAVGVSEVAEVGDCIGQGTSGGALVSQVNLDHGLQAYFSGSTDEYCYGSIRVQPLAYQDDVGRVSKSVSEARAGIVKVAAMLQDKGLQAHPDKTCFIVIGSKKFKESVARELEFSPLWFGNFKLKQKESDKYLGQIIHEDGLGRSAQATVEERQGKIKGATMEIKSLIEDFQMQAMGGLMTAWELWEKALIPSLLSGAGTWIGDISATVDLCDSIQNFFWRVILKVPESCPKMALRCETKQIGMKWRIWQEKIFLARRIAKKDDDTLVKQVYTEGKMMGWPGLWTEVKEICEEVGIPDVNEVFVSSVEVKKAIFNHHLKHMRENMSKKLDDIRCDDFSSEQPYMNEKSVEVGRMAFKIRCKMVEDIPGNFKNKYRTKARGGDEGLVCDHCQEKVTMDQAHCMACPAWEDIREGLDMTNILHLVKFFQEMLKKMDNKKDKNKGSNRPAQHDSEKIS